MGHYAPNLNPRKLHRYQVEDTRSGQVPTSIAVPKFLSEKAKDTILNGNGSKLSDAAEALAGVSLNGRAQTDEERMLKYSNVEIKYSRFGVDDFDFRFYNKTPYSGLETHIANSFINSLLQLYRFVPLVRNVAIQHAATSCVAANCLLCEFGFLVDMLEKAKGQNCQATNLLRAFGASREAANLSLFEHLSLANGTPLSTTIQAVNRYFLKQVAHDYVTMAGSSGGIDE
ncbi:poly(A)-specific ribonuclease, partial [Exophiala xenobiotica]